MQLYELFLIAVGLAMDAFAVSIARGLTMEKVRMREAATVGLWFGFFQFLMPLIGAFLGSRFLRQIEAVDHWIAFGLLLSVGGNMIREAAAEGKQEKQEALTAGKQQEQIVRPEEKRREQEMLMGERQAGSDLRFRTMLPLAIATSIDALAVGFTFGLLQVRIVPASLLIGCITFGISVGGVFIGKAFGARFKKGAAIAGGAVLIGIGVKILLEHLGVLA